MVLMRSKEDDVYMYTSGVCGAFNEGKPVSTNKKRLVQKWENNKVENCETYK